MRQRDNNGLAGRNISLVFMAAWLTACSGGGGDGTPSGNTPTPTPTPTLPPVVVPGLVSAASTFTAGCSGVASNGTLFVNAEVEPHIAINPTNPLNLIASWQQDRWSDGGSLGVATGVSFDGGTTWTTRAMPASRCGGGNAGNAGDFERATDPWVTFSPNGTAYQMSLGFSGAALQAGSSSAMLVYRSTDGGRTWGNAITLIADGATAFNDKNSMTADPLDSRYVYATWDRLTQDNRGPLYFARSIDGGQTWEPARTILDPGVRNQTIGGVIGVLPDGTVFNFFTQLTVVAGSTVGTYQVMRSTDKGATWSQPIKAGDFLGVGGRDPDTGAAIRDASFLAQISVGPQGQIYAVWQDARFAGGARDNIVLARSLDGGLTWLPPIRVSPDANVQALLGNVNARVDGTVAVSYLDMRNNSADTSSLLVDYWLATSRDSATWTERRITSASFNLSSAPQTARGLFLGDYNGLVSSSTAFYPVYVRTTGDITNRNDVFVTPIIVPTGSVADSVNLRSVAEVESAYAPSREHRQRVHDNIVRKMEQRVPGWAARRGITLPP